MNIPDTRARNWALSVILFFVAACGGGSGTAENGPPPNETGTCNPADAATFSECGTVFVGLSDADGDFLTYTVDIVQLTLTTANGRVVNALPRSTRVDFTDYVDLTELLTVATVPPAIYVSGSITLDYGNAEIFVESGDASKEAIVVDASGAPLEQASLDIHLSNRDRLVVTRGRPSFLQLDFDLDASHIVDLGTTPATATSEAFIIAEVLPVDEKDLRVRGPLVAVNEDASNYVVALRPFRDRIGDFGRARVHVNSSTEYEVDGEMFVGPAGLQALAAAGPGTPTVAAGTYNVAAHEFTANLVLAGSSVPGHDRDAIVGNVIARNGNFLTVRGAKILPWDRPAHFHDDVVVEVGPNTKVFKDGDGVTDLDIDAISIGQRVTIVGNQPGVSTDAFAPQILFDATRGAVRMHVTTLGGIVNEVNPGQTDITLFSIDRRRVGIFDFGGTGQAPELDADPGDYEIATGALGIADFAAGKPIVAKGFPTAFGMAPPDFTGRTLIDFTDVRSALGVGWGVNGTVAPFLSIGTDGLLLDNGNEDIDARHHIKQGPVLIDLTALDSDTAIVPSAVGRSVFYIKTADSIRIYSMFDDFVADLLTSLDGATTARSMHARGKYDADTNTFTANKIGIYLLEP